MARLRAPSSYLNRPSFARARLGSHLIVVARVLGQNASKVLFVEHDHMVGALASRRADQAFNMAVLPGRTEGRRPIPNAHRPDARLERGAERSVSLSRTRYFGAVSHGNASVICCANHSAVGWRVTANHSNCRRW